MACRMRGHDRLSLAPKFEVREIDAWAEPDGGWTWNDTFVVVKEFHSRAEDLGRLLRRKLREVRGRGLPRGVFYVNDSDWNFVEVRRRKDDCPVWALIRTSHER